MSILLREVNMSEQGNERRGEHPVVREHPEQQRQEETGREDPTEANEVGRPPSDAAGKRGPEQKDGERAA